MRMSCLKIDGCVWVRQETKFQLFWRDTVTVLRPVFEHEVTLPATAMEGEAAAAAVRVRLAALLMQFAKHPHMLIEGLHCRSVKEYTNDAGATVLERELVAGHAVFHDTVTVTEDRVVFAVPETGDMKASTFAISLEGGDGKDLVLRFHYEEDETVKLPAHIEGLRTKAWKAKDQDLAAWCVKHLGI